jgi:dienelactone hydrolase
VSTEDVANDILTATNFLLKQPFVKREAINVIGWSWGGAGAMQALGSTDRREKARVDAVVAYYPTCSYVKQWDSNVPVLVLIGANDSMAPVRNCTWLLEGLLKPRKVTVRVYDDAHHCFDNPDLPAMIKDWSGTFGYNEIAAKSSWAEISRFLKR